MIQLLFVLDFGYLKVAKRVKANSIDEACLKLGVHRNKDGYWLTQFDPWIEVNFFEYNGQLNTVNTKEEMHQLAQMALEEKYEETDIAATPQEEWHTLIFKYSKPSKN